MHWYNYLFATLAVIGFMGVLGIGMPAAAKYRNGHQMFWGVLLLIFWAALFYWNVYA